MITMYGAHTNQNTGLTGGRLFMLQGDSSESNKSITGRTVFDRVASTEDHKDSFLSRVKDYCRNYASDVNSSIEKNGWVSTVFKGVFHGFLGSFLGGMAGSFLGAVVGGPVGGLIVNGLYTAGGVGGFLHGLRAEKMF